MSRPGVALEGRYGRAYDEDAFRYLLEVERARAGRSRRASRLLLVRLASVPGNAPVSKDASPGQHLLAGLLQAVRETDIVGWYREGVVAGAILSDRADAADETVAAGLHRVRLALQRALPDALADRVRLRTAAISPGPRKS